MGFSFTKSVVADSHSEKLQKVKVDPILMGSRYSVRRSGIINFLCALISFADFFEMRDLTLTSWTVGAAGMSESRAAIMIFFISIFDLPLVRGRMVPIGSMYEFVQRRRTAISF